MADQPGHRCRQPASPDGDRKGCGSAYDGYRDYSEMFDFDRMDSRVDSSDTESTR